MASAYPICLMALSILLTSLGYGIKRLSHLNLTPSMTLPKNRSCHRSSKFQISLKASLSLCGAEGKKQKGHYPPKPVPNSKQRSKDGSNRSDLNLPEANITVLLLSPWNEKLRTLVEAARSMLIFSRCMLFLWDEPIGKAWLTKGDYWRFHWLFADSCATRVYNRRTKEIIGDKEGLSREAPQELLTKRDVKDTFQEYFRWSSILRRKSCQYRRDLPRNFHIDRVDSPSLIGKMGMSKVDGGNNVIQGRSYPEQSPTRFSWRLQLLVREESRFRPHALPQRLIHDESSIYQSLPQSLMNKNFLIRTFVVQVIMLKENVEGDC
ncbi:hypothetical protein Tco_1030387 [Tanacetum coccineum]|uniref:Uncharacterized protein n=1 Tax=Tanacetum coccineum TaxID=301880 RepID=A0ABQ5G626_9ASTR